MKFNRLAEESATSDEMQDRLRVWEAQARRAVNAYSGRPVARKADLEHDRTMVYWLPEACRSLRMAHGSLPSQVAAHVPTDQSKISRFEAHGLKGFPRELHALLAAYAAELGITVPIIWETAAMLWRCDTANRITPEDIQRIVEDVARKSGQPLDSKRATAPDRPRKDHGR